MRAYTQRARARTKENEMKRKKLNSETIKFGKYNGRQWRDLPGEYLKWICREIDTQSIQDKAANVLHARGVRDFERKPIKHTKARRRRRMGPSTLPQIDQEFRDIVTG